MGSYLFTSWMAWEADTIITALASLQRVAQRKVLGGRGTRSWKGGECALLNTRNDESEAGEQRFFARLEPR